eukprot:30655-Pelagococcus_subviridis.AAC.10
MPGRRTQFLGYELAGKSPGSPSSGPSLGGVHPRAAKCTVFARVAISLARSSPDAIAPSTTTVFPSNPSGVR